MKGIDASKLHYVKNKSLKDIIEDGIKSVDDNEDDEINGFEYKVADLENYEVIITLQPKSDSSDSLIIDCVGGFGYALMCEKKG